MRTNLILVVMVALVLGTASVWAQRQGGARQPQPQPGRTSIVPIPAAPYFYTVRSAVSPDGLTWTGDGDVRLEHASSPCAIVGDDGSIVLYFVDATRLAQGGQESINRAVSSDGIRFQVVDCTIEGGPPGRAIEPSVVRLEDGRFRLYYIPVQGSEAGEREVHSAVSSDGRRFVEEGICFTGPGLAHPEVVRIGETWHLYISGYDPRRTVVAVSTDGRQFAYHADLPMKDVGASTPVPLEDGAYRMYTYRRPGSAVESHTTRDGVAWTPEGGTRFSTGASAYLSSPCVVRTEDGYRMYYQEEQRPPETGTPPSDLYEGTRVLSLHLEFSQPDFWKQLEAHIEEETDIPARLTAEGIFIGEVGVRFKGNSSLRANTAKKPFNVSIDAFDSDLQLWGYQTLNLNNGFKDPTLVRETIAYDIFRRYIPACKTGFAGLYINDTYWGLYTIVQQPNNRLISEWFSNTDGNRYKGDPSGDTRTNVRALVWGGPDPQPYRGGYELKTDGNDNAWEDLIHLSDVLNNTPADAFESEIRRVLNVDRALWYLALCNLFVNLDSYLGSGHNFYLYSEPDGYFHIIPWDLNEAFGRYSEGLSATGIERLSPFYKESDPQRPLVSKLLSVPSFRARYLAHYRTLLDEVFHEDYLAPEIRKHQDLIRTSAEVDMQRLYSMADFDRNTVEDLGSGGGGRGGGGQASPGLLSLVNRRRAYLATVTELNRPAPAVTSVTHTPVSPAVDDTVWVQARVAGARPLRSVTLFCAEGDGRFSPVDMMDEGAHRDGEAGDGLFGAAIAPGPAPEVQYYILAENDAGSVTFAPPRAEHETFTCARKPAELPLRPGCITINEFMASNNETIADPQGDYDDWIELHNLTASAIDLTGMYLTDDFFSPKKWQFPDTTLAPHGYLLVWTDGDEEDTPGLHAGFRLSAGGEQIGVFDADSRGNALLDTLSFGPQQGDVSTGRIPDGTGSLEALETATPGRANAWDRTSADFNGDGTVDFSDFIRFASAFGTSKGDPDYADACDLMDDDTIDFSDFIVFAGAFGG